MVTGFFYLCSLIAVIVVILWYRKVALSKSPDAIHKGILGVIDRPLEKKKASRRPVSEWDGAHFRHRDE